MTESLVDENGEPYRLLTTQEVGRMLGVSEKTVIRLPLKTVVLAKRVRRYRPEDVKLYISSHVR